MFPFHQTSLYWSVTCVISLQGSWRRGRSKTSHNMSPLGKPSSLLSCPLRFCYILSSGDSQKLIFIFWTLFCFFRFGAMTKGFIIFLPWLLELGAICHRQHLRGCSNQRYSPFPHQLKNNYNSHIAALTFLLFGVFAIFRCPCVILPPLPVIYCYYTRNKWP